MSLILEPPVRPTSPADTAQGSGTPPPPGGMARHRRHDHRLARGLAMIATVIATASASRVVGLPSALAVPLAVVVALVVRHTLSHRHTGRTTVGRLVVMVALLGLVSATAWSFTGTLTDPGSDPVSDRTANWMRDHHMNLIVDTVEQHLDNTGAPSGAVDLAALPNASASTQHTAGSTSPDPSAAPASTGPASTIETRAAAPPTAPPTTAAPLDYTPAAAGPLLDTSLAGEGQWTPNTREFDGIPTTYTTFVRPDPANTGVVAAAVEVFPAATRLVYVPGTEEPGGQDWAWGATIPMNQRPDLVAAFNSGWKMKDSPGGAFTEGRTPVDLVDGRASVVIYSDGHVDVGAWGTDVSMTAGVVSVRQNLDLIVTGSRPVDGLTTGGTRRWGSTKYQTQFTRRSGLGITADGAVVYVSGTNLTTNTLARALTQVGAVRAMELDIHNQHPTFNFFTPAPGAADGVTGQSLLPDQVRPATRYLQPDQRDFFAVLIR